MKALLERDFAKECAQSQVLRFICYVLKIDPFGKFNEVNLLWCIWCVMNNWRWFMNIWITRLQFTISVARFIYECTKCILASIYVYQNSIIKWTVLINFWNVCRMLQLNVSLITSIHKSTFLFVLTVKCTFFVHHIFTEERDKKYVHDQDFANLIAWFGPVKSGKDGLFAKVKSIVSFLSLFLTVCIVFNCSFM